MRVKKEKSGFADTITHTNTQMKAVAKGLSSDMTYRKRGRKRVLNDFLHPNIL